MSAKETVKSTAYEVTIIAILAAILEVGKVLLNSIPNVELVSFLLIMFTLRFGIKRAMAASVVFTLVELFYWGFHIWVVFYIYAWPLLVLLTHLMRKVDSAILFALFSGAYGFAFGALSSIIIIFTSGFKAAAAWWVAGLSYDVVHAIGNFVIMLVLYRPIRKALGLIQTR